MSQGLRIGWELGENKQWNSFLSFLFSLYILYITATCLSSFNDTIFTLSSDQFSPAVERHVITRPCLSCQFAPGLGWVSSGPSSPYRWLWRPPPGDVLFGVCTEAHLIKGGHISSSLSLSQSLSFWDMGAHPASRASPVTRLGQIVEWKD